MMRSLWMPGALVALLAMLGAGCGGYSNAEAVDHCDIEQFNNGACFTDAVHDSCVACFEQCGDSCIVQESCPLQYTCPGG